MEQIEQMEQNELTHVLEAVLFAAGEPVRLEKLCDALEAGPEQVSRAAQALADEYDFGRRGIKLVRLEGSYQLCSRGEYGEAVRRVLETRRAALLSAAALEVLAVIAYCQPTTKTYVEQVRGVDSAYTVNSLCDKGLIEECGRLDVPGKPALFRTTPAFLRAFGLSSLTELPELDAFGRQAAQLLAPPAEQLELENPGPPDSPGSPVPGSGGAGP